VTCGSPVEALCRSSASAAVAAASGVFANPDLQVQIRGLRGETVAPCRSSAPAAVAAASGVFAIPDLPLQIRGLRGETIELAA